MKLLFNQPFLLDFCKLYYCWYTKNNSSLPKSNVGNLLTFGLLFLGFGFVLSLNTIVSISGSAGSTSGEYPGFAIPFMAYSLTFYWGNMIFSLMN